MTENDKYIIELAKASIYDKAPNPPKTAVDWSYIFAKSKEQSIAGLLFTAVSRLEPQFQPDGEIMAKWQSLMFSTIAQMSRRYNEFLRMNKLVSKMGIKMVGLKGCILRNLYPIPELRTMGDFDVLISPKDLGNLKNVFKANGYEIENDAFGIVCKNNDNYWEVFTTMEEEFRNTFEALDTQFLSEALSFGGVSFPNPTNFLTHLIVHTGKHYIREGAGIRNLCDMALFINKYKADIDFDEVKRLAQCENFGKMYSYLINTVGEWFDTDISDVKTDKCDTERFLEYSLENGIFGKHDNSLYVQASKHEDDSVSGLRKILFPTVKLLDYRYTYLKKYPFLLPVAWVHRLYTAVFKRKYTIKQMTGEFKEAIDYSNKRAAWLNELGIFEEH